MDGASSAHSTTLPPTFVGVQMVKERLDPNQVRAQLRRLPEPFSFRPQKVGPHPDDATLEGGLYGTEASLGLIVESRLAMRRFSA